MRGTYFNFNEVDIMQSSLFRIYIDHMIDAILGSTLACFRFNVNVKQRLSLYFDSVAEYLGLRNITSCMDRDQIIDKLNGRKLLVISAFAPLIADQISSGNAQKAYPGKKINITSVVGYRTNYTFFNNKYGRERNFFVTLQRMCTEIHLIDPSSYDVALTSVGAYSSLIASCIVARNRKVTLTLGSDIQTYFAILNKRGSENLARNNHTISNETFWITKIPDEFKPEDYQRIEGGCYW
jgi:hypothetical protein